MQGNGIVKTLLVLLFLVTAYQGFLFWKTNQIEQKGVVKCGADTGECYSNFLDEISDEVVLSIPLIKKFTYTELKGQQMGLGLDLKGGFSAVLQVDLMEYLINQSEVGKEVVQVKEPLFYQALTNAKTKVTNGAQEDYITIFGREWDAISGGKKLAEVFTSYGTTYSDRINLSSTTEEVVNILREDTRGVVNQTYNMLLKRIDKLGVIQPNIALDASRDLILVELPGIENPERARKMLESTANLEFWHTYNVTQVISGFAKADNVLRKTMLNDTVDAPVQLDTTYENVPVLGDNGDTLKNSAGLDSTKQEMVVTERKVAKTDGPLLSLLKIGSERSGGSRVGFADKNDMKSISEMLAREEVRSSFPQDVAFKWGAKAMEENGVPTRNYQLYAIKTGYDGEPPLKGDVITKANKQVETATGGEISVNVTMNSEGASTWATMTGEAYNKKTDIAILLDDEVVSAPGVNDGAITGGRTRITGRFSVQEADDLSNTLEIGALPASPRIIQEAQVGPTLGKENISRSITALIVGFGLVLLFMVAYYAGGGFVAIIALLANIIFIFAALSSMGNVLTLPGIAGIVLTIGMAVDANVIIFERIREELRNDKSLLLAIKDGFQHSYSAIIDANVTTLLTAGVLFYFGLGPIKGFATVLMVGVVLSLITAVLLGRLLIDWWTIQKKKDLSFSMGWSKNVFANLNVDWLSKRKISYAISSIVIIAGIVSMFTRSFDFGVDFSGGNTYTVQFPTSANVNTTDIKQALKEPFGGKEPTVKTFDTANRFSITTQYLIDTPTDSLQEKVFVQLHKGINSLSPVSFDDFQESKNPNAVQVITSNLTEPTIADDIRTSSIWATIAALVLIFTYIFVRFRKWQFSLGAVAALFHDVLITLAVFSIFWGIFPWAMEIDQAFIAALLTVVGYSINDTVVVFDRIREYMNTYTNRSKEDVINMAVSSTISRTLITSLTTLFVVLMLFIFGAGSIKGFAFALLIGVLVGTYSSVFIATPIMSDTTKDLKPKETKKTSKSSLARNKAKV